MTRLLTLAVLLPFGALAGDAMNAAAVAKYQDANGKISGRQYAEAITILNELAAAYPRVAEVFAARCSAQVAQRQYSGAEADCGYALSVKPELAAALYTLGMAQEGLGKRDAAIGSYRRYAALDATAAPYRDQATARMNALVAAGAPIPPPPPVVGSPAMPAGGGGARLIVYRNHTFAGPRRMVLVLDNKLIGDIELGQWVDVDAAPGEHMLEVRGISPNYYEPPRVWSRPVQLYTQQPVYVNFDTSGGRIVVQEMPRSQATVEIQDDCKKAYSRHIGPESMEAPPATAAVGGGDVVVVTPFGGVYAPVGVVAGPAPECRMSSRGINTCGYNCRHGSDGEVYCASRPDGRCALNSDGSWSCP